MKPKKSAALHGIKLIYLTVFVLFFRLAHRWDSRSMQAGAAVTMLSIFQYLAFFGAVLWIDIFLGQSHLPGKWFAGVTMIPVMLANYWYCYAHNRALVFENRFDDLPEGKREKLYAIAIVLCIAIAIFTVHAVLRHRALIGIA